MSFLFGFLSMLIVPRRDQGVPLSPSRQQEEMYRLYY